MTRKASRRSFLRSGLFLSLLVGSLLTSIFSYLALTPLKPASAAAPREILTRLELPLPRLRSPTSVEEAILRRRSLRDYLPKPITLPQLAQLLWSAQGITEPEKWVGLRTAPSAGGLYPLEVYAVVRRGGVEGLEAGVYHYEPHGHTLSLVARGDYSRPLMGAAVDQRWVGEAAFNLVFTAFPQRTAVKYGARSWQYIWQESGHAAQNVYLQATALGLGVTVIGAFYEEEIRRIVRAGDDEVPVYVVAVGVPRA